MSIFSFLFFAPVGECNGYTIFLLDLDYSYWTKQPHVVWKLLYDFVLLQAPNCHNVLESLDHNFCLSTADGD